MLPIIQIKGVTKRFGTLVANDSIDFDLLPGETHALVGENGAGKTTLMRILYGQYAPDEGEIFIDGVRCEYKTAGAVKHGIAMVHQNFMQIEELSILENIIMAKPPHKAGFINYKEAEEEIVKLLERFALSASPKAKIKTLCVGERQKVEIIKALYLGARILILDEPTAVLTPQETTELFHIIEDLKKNGKSIIFISHKLREVLHVGDRITVIRGGKVSTTFNRGSVDETDIARAMIGKKEVALLKNESNAQMGQEVCGVENLWYIDERSVPCLRNFSLSVQAGEILGIGGVEGNGQSELISLLVGLKKASGGRITLNGADITGWDIKSRREAGMGYISDDRMNVGLCLDASLDENIICGQEEYPEFSKAGFLLNTKGILQYASSLVSGFDIRGVGKNGQIKGMSGGNLQKIVLAREISRKPKLLIAAQPTRGLDIGAINFVREQILKEKERGAAILLISADLEELMSLSDRIIIMCGGACTGEVTDIGSVTEEDLGMMMGGITNSVRKEAKNA